MLTLKFNGKNKCKDKVKFSKTFYSLMRVNNERRALNIIFRNCIDNTLPQYTEQQ